MCDFSKSISPYISLLTDSLQKITQYNSTLLIYHIQGAHILLQIYSALLMSGASMKHIIETCEGAIQLYINCLYILDNIKPDEVNSYIDIIKELLYTKSIGSIKVSELNIHRPKQFSMFKIITRIIVFNEINGTKKNMQAIGKVIFLFNQSKESPFLNDRVHKLLQSQETFRDDFDVFCISSVISLQLYS